MSNLFKYAVMSVMLFCTLPVYGGTTLRDNDVYFRNNSGNENELEAIGFHITGHHITDGQPWDGVSTSMDGSDGYITVKAGRHGSEEVADWFKARARMAIGNVTANDWPGELNFAIHGRLGLRGKDGRTVHCTVVIGQGHTGAYNNWWIGGENMYEYRAGGHVWLDCPPADGHCGGVVLVDSSQAHADRFYLSALRVCRPPGEGEDEDEDEKSWRDQVIEGLK